MTADTPLGRLLADPPDSFALLHRPQSTGRDEIELLTGTAVPVATLAELPPTGPGDELLVMVPYRQIVEVGWPCHDDAEPVVAMPVGGRERVDAAELAAVAATPIRLRDIDFDIDDEKYAEIVHRVLTGEIAQGEGANFVIHRRLTAQLDGPDHLRQAIAAFGRLVGVEAGAYWTFLIHTGQRTFVGASPERHVSLADGQAVMNPISGTYRYPPDGPDHAALLEFLADRKETDELYMVVDEELKMMARVCPDAGRVTGPYLKAMSHLAHTEYLIEGRTTMSPADILRSTMFAPTVTGSPLQNAFAVIARHETRPRGYYSGVAALIGRDADGTDRMDSAILIRTADIDHSGQLRIGVGATLVRESTAAGEVAETHAKAVGVLSAFTSEAAAAPPPRPRLAEDPDVRRVLAARNDRISPYWLGVDTAAPPGAADLAGRTGLLVEAEDTFTTMLARQLRTLGVVMTILPFDAELPVAEHDFVLMGPGPGDPGDRGSRKIAALYRTVETVLAARRPLLAVCLGHQVLSHTLGLDLIRLDRPNQGTQREIDLFGQFRRVGFYNSYAALSARDTVAHPYLDTPLSVCRDADSGQVHALRGPRLAGAQFHPESVLTQQGPAILAELLAPVLGTATPTPIVAPATER